MPASLYVYYKLSDQPRRELAAVVRAMQAELFTQAGVAGRLLQRRDDDATWMEVYEDVAESAAFSLQLQAALQLHGFDRFGLARHDEWFVPLAEG